MIRASQEPGCGQAGAGVGSLVSAAFIKRHPPGNSNRDENDSPSRAGYAYDCFVTDRENCMAYDPTARAKMLEKPYSPEDAPLDWRASNALEFIALYLGEINTNLTRMNQQLERIADRLDET